MKIVFAAVIATFCFLQVSGGTVKERLLRDLTVDYEPAIDPGNIDLKMKVAIICAWQDNSTGFVVVSGWELYMWTDERLQWSPDEYGGLSKLSVPKKYVWTPDMMQYNCMTSEEERDDDVNVVLMSDGSAIYVPRAVYQVACAENDSRIICDMRIGSWSYDGNNLRLQVEDSQDSDGLDLTYYSSACPLAVESHTAEVVGHTYPCCEEAYPSMDISITFTRRQ